MFAQSPVRQDVSDLGVFGLDKQTAATDDVSSGNAADDIVAGVCVLLCFVDPILGNLTVRGHSLSQGTWGCRILTLHHNYVAGYTGPLLFLFERTHNYSGDVCGVLLCFIKPILGNRYGPGVEPADQGQTPIFNHLNRSCKACVRL